MSCYEVNNSKQNAVGFQPFHFIRATASNNTVQQLHCSKPRRSVKGALFILKKGTFLDDKSASLYCSL